MSRTRLVVLALLILVPAAIALGMRWAGGQANLSTASRQSASPQPTVSATPVPLATTPIAASRGATTEDPVADAASPATAPAAAAPAVVAAKPLVPVPAAPLIDEPVAQPTETTGADGSVLRSRLVRRDGFKYPLIRIEERTVGGTTIRQDMVGDHLLVRLAEGTTADQAAAFARDHGFAVRRRVGSGPVWLLSFPATDASALPLARERLLAAKGDVANVEPDLVVRADVVPNDPYLNLCWGLNNSGQSGGTPDADIDAPEAWELGTGGSTVKVGIIDTGMDATHPDLVSNRWTNPGESGAKATNGLDDDGNGYIDDANGWNFYDDNNNPADNEGHGTHVAGTIAARGGNAKGVPGVNWYAALIPLRFLGPGGGTLSDGLAAIQYSTAIGCHVTNNSWGWSGGYYSVEIANAIAAANTAGIPFVAAAGNAGTNNDSAPFYPASYPMANVISVAATTHTDALAGFSCFGATTVDLGAPGDAIVSTWPGNQYAYLSGTSMATPHVTGAVALMRSKKSGMTPTQVRQALLDTVDPKPALTGMCVSGGRLNLFRAVAKVMTGVVDGAGDTVAEAGVNDGLLATGETLAIQHAVKSIGSGTALSVTATLTTTDPNLTVIDGGVVYGNLASGATSTGDGPFLVSVAPGVSTPYTTQGVIASAVSGKVTNRVTVSLTVYTVSTIAGTVRTGGGAPIAGATLDLTAGPMSRSTTSLADGGYVLPVIAGTYTVRAQTAGFPSSSLSGLTVPPAITSADFTFGGTNQPPVAGPVNGSTLIDTAVDLAPVLSDPDSDPVTPVIVSAPANGTATVVGGQLHYVPNPAWTGTDTFTYAGNDGIVTGAAATVTVIVSEPTGLPSPWVAEDVGTPALAGSTTYAWSPGIFTAIGGGSDISAKADQFHFVHQPYTGNVVITARVTGMTNTNNLAKAGIMIRDGLAKDAKHVCLVQTPGTTGVLALRRTSTAGYAGSTTIGLRSQPWLRLKRLPTSVQAFVSDDGVTWPSTPNTTVTITLGSTVEIGLVVCSKNAAALCTALLSDVMVEPGGVAARPVHVPSLLSLLGLTGMPVVE